MGQGYSVNTIPAGASALESTELSDLTYEKHLGGTRFLRTIRARHQCGVVVVKTCSKSSPTVSFRRYAKALKAERQALKDVPNALPYQKIRETATSGVLVRQFIHSSLYDRVSIRPFLEGIEKKWIAFQLLCAVRDCHARGVFHGDIKSENVLVTSWGWVYLTDFASAFKPVYLPEDNPADFSYYYDTSARRTCYLAPERFLTATQNPSENDVQWNMDIFSLGCVIAELFTEAPTFTLSQLFRYRKKEYDPTVLLMNKISDEHVRALISSMLRLDPSERWHAQDYLDEYKGKAFPLYFYQHFHTLIQEITQPSPGRRSAMVVGTNNGESDQRIDRIYEDYEMLSISLDYEDTPRSQQTRLPGMGRGLFPLQVDLPHDRHTATSTLAGTGDNGTFILLNVITASMRSAARASSKIRACELLLAFAERVPDEAKLDRILPYVMPFLDDSNDMVLVAAVRTMTQLLALVTVTSPVNSFLFTQYIFPRLQVLVATKGFKQNAIVRATYAACLASLAETASRFLDMMQALRAEGTLQQPDIRVDDEVEGYSAYHNSYDATRIEVLDQFEGQTKVFLTDSNTAVRRAFLSSVPSLCVFFGESRTSDLILSHLNTYLNDPDWMLKCAFFRTIVGVAVYVGGPSLEEFILPLMLQALTDPQEFVVEQVLRSLASMAEMGLLQRSKTWELIDTVARFQLHPNMWIKEAASHFIAAATTYLSVADIRILVAPLIASYLKTPVGEISEADLLDALKKPLPRSVLDLALQWAEKADRSVFWKQAKDLRQLSYRGYGQMPPISSVADLGPKSLGRVPKTDEDEQWLGRLRNSGMRSDDEFKLLAFREYLWRNALRLRRDESPDNYSTYEQLILLTKLNITPQTVIFDTDIDIYNRRRQENGASTDLTGAIEEATTPGVEEDMGPLQSNDMSSADAGKGILQIPGLKKQNPGSGQSLSSSPGSGIGLPGKSGDRSLRTRGNAASLISGTELRNKSLAEVATDETTAAGRLNVPSEASRRLSITSTSDRLASGRLQSSKTGHNYAGNDPTVLRLLDAVYVDSFPFDAAEFGPMVQALKRGPIPSTRSLGATGLWRPQGQTVAVLGDHTARINRLAVSPDHLFFVSGGDDGTVRVWDTGRLERNISHRPRFKQSFGDGVKITSLCFIDSTHCFICTGSDGTVHFIKVSITESEHGAKFGPTQLLRTWQIPGASAKGEFAVWSEHYRGESASTLMLATNFGRIVALDLRYMSVVFELQNPAQHGTPTCFCIGRRHDWLLVGTINGVLDLWDLRFRLRLRSWAFSNAAPIVRLQLHPSRKTARRNRVCVSGGTGRGEATVWDIEKAICHEVYRAALPYRRERLNARDYELQALDDDRRVASSHSLEADDLDNGTTISTSPMPMLFSSYYTSEDSDVQHIFALTGGPDNKVRFWDAERLDGCRLVSDASSDQKPSYTIGTIGLDLKVISEAHPEPDNQDQPAESSRSGPASPGKEQSPSKKLSSNQATPRSSLQHLLDGHLDTITDVALLERPFGMVLSADRSGQIFVHQ